MNERMNEVRIKATCGLFHEVYVQLSLKKKFLVTKVANDFQENHI